jgi:D-amino-acid dehydrogenase
VLFCPLDSGIRVSGFADFVGFDNEHDAERIALLTSLASQIAPEAADYNAKDKHSWAGSRPMTPDGRPLVGATRVQGLYLNCGHGMLGWTLACATAEQVAQAVSAGS